MSGLQIEVDVLANRAMKSVARKIAARIQSSSPLKVIFYDDKTAQSVTQYRAVIEDLNQIKDRYDDILNSVKPNDNHAIIPTDTNAVSQQSSTNNLTSDAKVNISKPTTDVANAQSGSSLVQFAQSLNKTTDDLINSLFGNGQTNSTIGTLLTAEATYKLTATADVVFVNVASAGGNNATKHSLLSSIFTAPKTFHSGGCVVSYTQFKPDGSIRSAGEFDGYTGYYQDKISSCKKLEANVDQ